MFSTNLCLHLVQEFFFLELQMSNKTTKLNYFLFQVSYNDVLFSAVHIFISS